MVLLPLAAAHVDGPIVAAGGICDARSMAAALVLGAAISFIEDVARTWHLTRYVGVADEITAIALSILTSRS
jgi:hypothetical protein